MFRLDRVALVYDWVDKWGGAERVLLALHDLFPAAPLFTAVYNSHRAQWAQVFEQVTPSFLQHFPSAMSRHELYPWLTPLAFESLSGKLDDFEVVISVTSAAAKGLITKPQTFHLCYCLTPTRYLYSHRQEYLSQMHPIGRWVSRPLFSYLRSWDYQAARRPDSYLAISQTVRRRLKTYYGIDSAVVYPPVEVDKFQPPAPRPWSTEFFLYVGRLVSYKRAQVLVEIFNDLRLPLAIIGTGHLEKKLRQAAAPHIRLLGHVSEADLIAYYQHAQAVIYFHEEDFGLVPVEAMAAGTPVIGLARGGVTETVVPGLTGVLVDEDSPSALRRAIVEFRPGDYLRQNLLRQATKFSRARFNRQFSLQIARKWKNYQTIYMS